MWSEIKWIKTLKEERNWTAIRKLNVCSTWTTWSRSGLYWQLHDRVLQTPTAGPCLCEATQNYHKAAKTACHQGWRMDVTRQRNVQMKEKTAKKVREVLHRWANLAPWCLYSLKLLHWCKVWLWPAAIMGVWVWIRVWIPRVNHGRFLHGFTLFSMLLKPGRLLEYSHHDFTD